MDRITDTDMVNNLETFESLLDADEAARHLRLPLVCS
jgi:hypothetical protein